MELRLCNPFRRIIPLPSNFSYQITSSSRPPFLSVRSSHLDSNESRKLVLEVKEKLEKNHQSLPVGKNGRDDEDLILWFLKDRKFSVQESVEKLHKAIKWRQQLGVSELSEDSVKSIAETGKAYLHDFLDVNGRPVLIVDAAKHFPGFDAFYYYYPRRLVQVLFVDAPFIFKPIWQLAKPLLKSYASLMDRTHFCFSSSENVYLIMSEDALTYKQQVAYHFHTHNNSSHYPR